MSSQILICSIYNPPRSRHNKTVESVYSSDAFVAAYPYARQALYDGLKSLGLLAGQTILIPDFICRDILAPIHSLGLKPMYYSLDKNLSYVGAFQDLPKCDVILAVHYFGLTTDLTFYQNYCKLHDAFLVVDNAHGFLSQNGDIKLGTEGDIGIISIRKTLPMPTGALLLSKKNIESLDLEIKPLGFNLKIKNALRPLVDSFGFKPLIGFTEIKRLLRLFLKGHALPPSLDSDEIDMPDDKAVSPYNEYFTTMNIDAEVNRRRDLFKYAHDYLKGQPIEVIRSSLAEGECPYGYPFYCQPRDIESVKAYLLAKGFEIISWPSLPKDIEGSAPEYYKNLYLVKFLW